MKTFISRVAGPLGGLFLFFGLFARLFVTGEFDAIVIGQLVIGVAALVLYAATAFDELRGIATGRGSLFVVTNVVAGIALLAIAVFANYAAQTARKEWDFTKDGIHTLSEQTTALLKGLTEENAVHVTAFYRSTDQEFGPLEDLLRKYQTAGAPHFTFEFIDPTKNPKTTREAAITATGPRTIVKSKNMKEARAKEPTEEALTNAVAEVGRGLEQKLYFLSGHGEKAVGKGSDTPQGLKLFVDGLTSEGYRAEELSLLAQKDVPDDALAVVVAGPLAGLTEGEQGALERFAAKGGRFLVALDPGVEHGYAALLAQWGIEQVPGTIVDPATQQLSWAIVQEASEHPVAQTARGLPAVFPEAAGMRNKGAEGYTVTEVFKTGRDAWAESGNLAEGVSRDANDVPGPVPLVAASTRKLDGGNEVRAVVFGDADFLSNGFIRQLGNRDLALNAVQWLAGKEAKITIRPKLRAKSSVTFITAEQDVGIRFFALNGLPLLLLALGFSVKNLRRR